MEVRRTEIVAEGEAAAVIRSKKMNNRTEFNPKSPFLSFLICLLMLLLNNNTKMMMETLG